jgi:ComF family protein
MLTQLKTYYQSILHGFFPHHCLACGTDVLPQNQLLCLPCTQQLPHTRFFIGNTTAIEMQLAARVPFTYVGSAFYYDKTAAIHHLVEAVKYKGNKAAGIYLGKLLGASLSQSAKMQAITHLVPMPLHIKKQQKRGYNQALLIAEGVQQVWRKPIANNFVLRTVNTETQTKKDRVSRWQNMQNVFSVPHPELLAHQHILLIDDVLTTGATMEACAQAIFTAQPNCQVSIATVAYAKD